MHRPRTILFFLLLCLTSNKASADSGDTLKLLFIGNSLTYTNDLPDLVKEIGEKEGKVMTCDRIALPDYSLEDHWNDGKAAAAIEEGKYDYVILQQGPSALPESQVLLKTYTEKFAVECRKARSVMALFMVWPSRARALDFDKVISSYSHAAEENGALLCPAGLAWKKVWQVNPALPLYGADGFHPGMDGTVLAAMTIYGNLLKRSSLDFLTYGDCSWKETISKDTHTLFLSVIKSMMP